MQGPCVLVDAMSWPKTALAFVPFYEIAMGGSAGI
jgi:hypothetical protein